MRAGFVINKSKQAGNEKTGELHPPELHFGRLSSVEKLPIPSNNKFERWAMMNKRLCEKIREFRVDRSTVRQNNSQMCRDWCT